MRYSPRRALRGAAAAVATSAILLGSVSAAQAQRPEKLGDGIKTGQLSTQLFTFNAYINNGSLGATGNTNPITGISAPCMAGGASATTSECRWERLEGLFRFLESKGVTSVELFDHANIPSATAANLDVAGWTRYRALLDKYHLHAAGWHGSTNENNWGARIAAAKIIGSDYLGSGGVADPGIATYAAVLNSAQALNRMGKRSVEGGVGPAYIHNHTDEFDRKYVHNGVEMTAFDILMAETDPRYVVAEVDVFWSSDAFDDVTGQQTANLINQHGTRVQMLHIKDGINITARGAGISSRGGSPRATGTGELDFRPIFTAANNRVRYYHMEQDGGSPHDGNISFTNLKGSGPTAVGTALALPQTFPSVAAGTPAANNVVPVTIQNTGDAPLTITALSIPTQTQPDAGDFAIVSQNCTTAGGGGPLPPGALATDTTPAVPRGACVVNIGFKPTKTNYTSVAALQITSNSDNATETVLLTGTSTGDALGSVGGTVGTVLNLAVAGAGSFGSFVPGVARTYTTSLAATATSTAGDAALTVTDSGATAPGRLVNGSFALASPLGVRAVGLGDNPLPAYQSLGATPLLLRSWTGPFSNDSLTLGLQQAIGASEPLRAGQYSKTLTFTLSTTTP